MAPQELRDRVSPVLIGRADALDLAIRRWDAAPASGGHLLLVAGEAGIGKTRLLSEIAARVDAPPMPRAGAYPRETDAAGAILLNLSDELRRLGLTEPARLLRERLAEEATGGDDARRRRLLLGDLAQIIGAMLASERLLLRLEDLHWADELSLDVLDRVAASLHDTSSMIVASYRSDEIYTGSALRRWRGRLLEQRLAEEVRLPRLDLAQTEQIVEVITGSTPSVELVESLYRRSDGIPLHLEELIASDSASSVLETVAEAVNARVAVLQPESRSIVAAASVIGRSFDAGLLERITGGSTLAVENALRAASERHIVQAAPGGGGFDFRHSILREAIYEAIPARERSAIHAAVARAADEAGLGEAYVSEHYERAGTLDLAHVHAMLAAENATRVSAHREAAGLLRRAERTIARDADPRALAELHERLAVELAATDDNEGAECSLREAIGLYRELGDEQSAALLVPSLMATRHQLGDDLATRVQYATEALERLGDASPLVRAKLLGALSAAYMLDRRLDESMDYGREADAIVHQLDVDLTLGSVLAFAGSPEGWPLLERAIRSGEAAGLEAETSRGFRMLGSTASVVVEYDRATSWLTEGIDYAARTERWNDHHYLVAHLGHVRWATGDWDEALRHAHRALADGRGITTRITALIVLGYVALGRGAFDTARATLDEALELGERMHELQRISPALWGLAELALRSGDVTLTVDLCERGLRESARVIDSAYLFPFLVTGTRALIAIRDIGAARDWLSRCSELLLVTRHPWHTGRPGPRGRTDRAG